MDISFEARSCAAWGSDEVLGQGDHIFQARRHLPLIGQAEAIPGKLVPLFDKTAPEATGDFMGAPGYPKCNLESWIESPQPMRSWIS